MSEADTQKAVEALEALKEKVMPIIEEIVEAAKKIIKVVVKTIKKIFKNIVIDIVKQLDNKKACKCLDIWLHTKNRRIRKKQSKRLNNIILSYMPL